MTTNQRPVRIKHRPAKPKADAMTPERLAEVTPEVTSLHTPLDQRVSPGHQEGTR